MTEYDYSPDAYEKHLATQSRISRWVDKTRRYAPSNPFVPATPAVECISLRKDSNASHRRQKHSHRRIRSEEPPPDKPRAHSALQSERPRPKAPVRWHTISDHRSGPSTRESVPHMGTTAPVLPPPALRSRPLRSYTAPPHVYHYPVQDQYPYAAYTLPNRAGAGTSGHNSSTRYASVHNTPNRETSTSKRSLLKRLLGGIISKSGNGNTKGRGHNSVRR